MNGTRWRRKLTTWPSRLDHAEWVMVNSSSGPDWVLVLLPILAALAAAAGFLAWEWTQDDIYIISSDAVPIYGIIHGWPVMNAWTFSLFFVIAPFTHFLFPDYAKPLYVLLILFAVIVFAVSCYQDYRLNRALIDGGWEYCEFATRRYALRWQVIYAKHAEWCPRNMDEMF